METIFIVDDEEDLLQSLQFYLQQEGYEVKTFTKSKDMMEALETEKAQPDFDGCKPAKK